MPAGVNNTAGDAVEHVNAAAGEAGEALALVAGNLGDQARDQAVASGQAVLRQTRRAGDGYAAAKPLTALLVAGAVGYGLGYLMHRS